LVKELVVACVRFYQKFLSPLMPGSCRYYPTCSNYTIMAVEKYGVLKGLVKSAWRILRCNPFSKGGIDYP